jgi:hypothetical protein
MINRLKANEYAPFGKGGLKYQVQHFYADVK